MQNEPKTKEEIAQEVDKIDNEWANHIENNGRYDGDEDWRDTAIAEIKGE
jgi:hypothetical protein